MMNNKTPEERGWCPECHKAKRMSEFIFNGKPVRVPAKLYLREGISKATNQPYSFIGCENFPDCSYIVNFAKDK